MSRSSRATLGRLFTVGVLAASLHAPLLAQSPAAQTQTGKEITIERLFRPPSLGGGLTQGIEWAPDSKRFSYLDRQGATGARPRQAAFSSSLRRHHRADDARRRLNSEQAWI